MLEKKLSIGVGGEVGLVRWVSGVDFFFHMEFKQLSEHYAKITFSFKN